MGEIQKFDECKSTLNKELKVRDSGDGSIKYPANNKVLTNRQYSNLVIFNLVNYLTVAILTSHSALSRRLEDDC